MSERTEPHVSGQELRAALAAGGRSRPSPLIAEKQDKPEEQPAWEWRAEISDGELDDLRRTAEELTAEVEQLQTTLRDARAMELELRSALERLADAPPWRRRGLVAELVRRGML
jgi:predicted RNase H-like nuclease (RuvC/YqgF family)